MSAYRALVVQHVQRDALAVTLYRRVEGGVRVLELLAPDDPDADPTYVGFRWREREVAAEALDLGRPTLDLPIDAAEAMVAAIADVLPPSAAVERHLEDARDTRDRLIDRLLDVADHAAGLPRP